MWDRLEMTATLEEPTLAPSTWEESPASPPVARHPGDEEEVEEDLDDDEDDDLDDDLEDEEDDLDEEFDDEEDDLDDELDDEIDDIEVDDEEDLDDDDDDLDDLEEERRKRSRTFERTPGVGPRGRGVIDRPRVGPGRLPPRGGVEGAGEPAPIDGLCRMRATVACPAGPVPAMLRVCKCPHFRAQGARGSWRAVGRQGSALDGHSP